MIRRFTINGFKRFDRETGIDLADVTVLVGANNSGKSTVLQALTLFQYCVETTRTNGEDGSAFSLARRTVSPEEFGVLPVAEPTDLWPNGRTTARGKPKPIMLAAEFSNGASVAFHLRISYNRFSIVPKVDGDLDSAIVDRDIRLVPIFSGFAPREEYMTPPARQDRIRLQRHGEMVRNLLWDLKENAEPRWRRLVSLLSDVFPESSLAVDFQLDVDRFLKATYRDAVLTKDRDLIAAGSGFHQVLQILAAVLAPGAGTVLLDEPDAHLHGRLQAHLMEILTRLAQEEGEQFVLATHSPQILSAAPPESVRVCIDGRIVPLAAQPEQFALLEDLGAIDRMELIPLLVNRAVVFVENRSDRKLLEVFATKHWGHEKMNDAWRGLTFLYTYTSPLASNLLAHGRQVDDLMRGTAKSTSPVRMMAIGDRDYRTDRLRAAAIREHNKKAGSDQYRRFEMRLRLWEANEIENYVLDRRAIAGTLKNQARSAGVAKRWSRLSGKFSEEMDRLIEAQREEVRQAVATRIQHEDRSLELTTAMIKADEFLETAWQEPERWCDAKAVLAGLRTWLQSNAFPMRLGHREIIDAMDEVPKDVRLTLNAMSSLRRAPSRKRAARSK